VGRAEHLTSDRWGGQQFTCHICSQPREGGHWVPCKVTWVLPLGAEWRRSGRQVLVSRGWGASCFLREDVAGPCEQCYGLAVKWGRDKQRLRSFCYKEAFFG
jgi:hypothetical protein